MLCLSFTLSICLSFSLFSLSFSLFFLSLSLSLSISLSLFLPLFCYVFLSVLISLTPNEYFWRDLNFGVSVEILLRRHKKQCMIKKEKFKIPKTVNSLVSTFSKELSLARGWEKDVSISRKEIFLSRFVRSYVCWSKHIFAKHIFPKTHSNLTFR
jgi:hypothetical protein